MFAFFARACVCCRLWRSCVGRSEIHPLFSFSPKTQPLTPRNAQAKSKDKVHNNTTAESKNRLVKKKSTTPDLSSILMSSDGEKQKWFPLESNPSLMNDYVKKLGFDTSLYEFYDVFSTEDWALEMLPQPVVAVVMLYPLTNKQTSFEANDTPSMDVLDKVWFIKQRIGNACGTIGILHSILNAPDGLRSFPTGSWLENFYRDCPPPLDPVLKAERLEGDNTIAKLHDEATSSESNQTNRGNLDDDIITHFVALVNVDGVLYELDGRKAGPVAHGKTSPMSLLTDSCGVVKKFMERDPEEMRFTILALAPKQQD